MTGSRSSSKGQDSSQGQVSQGQVSQGQVSKGQVSQGQGSDRAAPTLRQATRQFVRLLRLIRPYWTPLLQGIGLALLLGLLGMVTPYLTKLLVDEAYPTENVTLMHVLVGGILALALATTLLGTLRGYFSLHINTRLNTATRLMFFNHLQHLPVSFFDRHQVGEITSRFQDVGRALESISRVFQTVFVQGVYLLLVPPILFLLEWRLALVAIISLPITFSVTALSGPILRRSWKRSSEAYADLSAFQVETLSHIRTFKTMGLEHDVYQRARGLVDHAMVEQLKAGGLGQAFGAVNGLLYALNSAVFMWFGWTLILTHRMTLGEFLAFAAYISYLYNPIQQLIQLFSDFQQSAVHLSRMFEYLDEPVEQEPSLVFEPPAPLETLLRGGFSLRDVSFGYAPGTPVLRHVDLNFPAGKVSAVVGPSGSGKTSLLRLLAGLQLPDQGIVEVDGRSLEELSLRDLRQQIAVVWQEVSLVKGTFWENLTLACGSVDRAEVDRVLALCGLSEVLQELPEGYQSTVSEWGSSLSAGQRQRVALARALLRKAPVLLLDEATANVDVETEQSILEGVFQELQDRTVIFVTHRLASAALADQICVLRDGEVQGCGSHQELATSCTPYRRMLQAGGGSLPPLLQASGAGS